MCDEHHVSGLDGVVRLDQRPSHSLRNLCEGFSPTRTERIDEVPPGPRRGQDSQADVKSATFESARRFDEIV